MDEFNSDAMLPKVPLPPESVVGIFWPPPSALVETKNYRKVGMVFDSYAETCKLRTFKRPTTYAEIDVLANNFIPANTSTLCALISLLVRTFDLSEGCRASNVDNGVRHVIGPYY
jgi:hypothetical protein